MAWGSRHTGTAEADAVFTPERLREQQLQIVKRLEHVGRQARVISFPGKLVRRTLTAPVYVDGQIESHNERAASAMSIVMLALSFSLIVTVEWLQSRRRAHGGVQH